MLNKNVILESLKRNLNRINTKTSILLFYFAFSDNFLKINKFTNKNNIQLNN